MMGIKELSEGILDIIYPKRCPICMDIIPIDKEVKICETCIEKLPYITDPRCKKCSKPIDDETIKYCYDCTNNEHYYNKGWAVWLYEGNIKKSLQRFKYNNNKNYGRIFAKEVVTLYNKEITEAKIDLIVPVPLYIKKQKKRGYNQAQIIANNISKYLDIPCNNDCLVRIKDTKPQKNLSDKERINNTKKAFKVVMSSVVMDKKILICDDIYTTGNTINSCAKELLNSGAKEIYFCTLAIGKGF
jgi:ComF family protein